MSDLKDVMHLIWHEWKKDDINRKAAAIAYYAVIALPSLLIVIITVAGWVFGEQTVNETLLGQASLYADTDTMSFLDETIQNVRLQGKHTLLSIVGFMFFFLSSVKVIHELRHALNAVLQIKNKHVRLENIVWEYALSFIAMVIFILLIAAFVLTDVILSSIEGRISNIVVLPLYTINATNHVLTYAGLIGLFMYFYIFLPSYRYPIYPVFLCSVITSSLVIIGTQMLTMSASLFHLGYAYGVAASFIILFLWMYYASFVFLFGGEMLEVFTRKYSIRR